MFEALANLRKKRDERPKAREEANKETGDEDLGQIDVDFFQDSQITFIAQYVACVPHNSLN